MYKRRVVGYIISILLAIVLSGILATIVSYTLGYLIYSAVSPQLHRDAEEALSILGFGFLMSLLLTLLSIVPSYLLSMRLGVYLREKRGWEIRHPRRLFLVSLLLIAAAFFALIAWSGVSV